LALMAANLRKLRLRKTEKERTQKFYSYWIKFLGIFETCVTASLKFIYYESLITSCHPFVVLLLQEYL
ncbi:hypothetical protein, partial [Facklamia hominis]